MTELGKRMGKSEEKREQSASETAGAQGGTCLRAGDQQCWVFRPPVVRDPAAK